MQNPEGTKVQRKIWDRGKPGQAPWETAPPLVFSMSDDLLISPNYTKHWIMHAVQGGEGQFKEGKHVNLGDTTCQVRTGSLRQENNASHHFMPLYAQRCNHSCLGPVTEVPPTVEAHLLFQLNGIKHAHRDGMLQDHFMENLHCGDDLEAALTLTVLSSKAKKRRIKVGYRKKVSPLILRKHAYAYGKPNFKASTLTPFRLLSPIFKAKLDAVPPFVIIEKCDGHGHVLVLESAKGAIGTGLPCSFSLLSPLPITPRRPAVILA